MGRAAAERELAGVGTAAGLVAGASRASDPAGHLADAPDGWDAAARDLGWQLAVARVCDAADLPAATRQRPAAARDLGRECAVARVCDAADLLPAWRAAAATDTPDLLPARDLAAWIGHRYADASDCDSEAA
jgi:hypothetical protein